MEFYAAVHKSVLAYPVYKILLLSYATLRISSFSIKKLRAAEAGPAPINDEG